MSECRGLDIESSAPAFGHEFHPAAGTTPSGGGQDRGTVTAPLLQGLLEEGTGRLQPGALAAGQQVGTRIKALVTVTARACSSPPRS